MVPKEGKLKKMDTRQCEALSFPLHSLLPCCCDLPIFQKKACNLDLSDFSIDTVGIPHLWPGLTWGSDVLFHIVVSNTQPPSGCLKASSHQTQMYTHWSFSVDFMTEFKMVASLNNQISIFFLIIVFLTKKGTH